MAFGSFDSKKDFGTVSEINMVPLIDVMLVLLVIFIITAPLMSNSIAVNLPKVNAEHNDQKGDAIEISIKEDGKIYWKDEPTELSGLEQRMAEAAKNDPQPVLKIRADADSKYEAIAQVMGKAKEAGLGKIGFVTSPDPKTDAQSKK